MIDEIKPEINTENSEINNQHNDQQWAQKFQDCQIELSSWKEKYLQVNADIQNLQRRTAREQASWVHTVQGKILNEILLIVDDFERALTTAQTQTTPDTIKGFELINQSLHKLLKNQGATEFADYTTFNPEIHEALMHVQNDSVSSGSIIQVFRKGYRLNGVLLRTAQVSVAQ